MYSQSVSMHAKNMATASREASNFSKARKNALTEFFNVKRNANDMRKNASQYIHKQRAEEESQRAEEESRKKISDAIVADGEMRKAEQKDAAVAKAAGLSSLYKDAKKAESHSNDALKRMEEFQEAYEQAKREYNEAAYKSACWCSMYMKQLEDFQASDEGDEGDEGEYESDSA
jgi:hypothetical protein